MKVCLHEMQKHLIKSEQIKLMTKSTDEKFTIFVRNNNFNVCDCFCNSII